MFINKAWRILLIGDGDLSFAYALQKNYQPKKLVATVFDREQDLIIKYGDKYIKALKELNITPIFKVDITNPQSWKKIPQEGFDVVIFQFPLIPSFKSKAEFERTQGSINILNRSLLRNFLINSFKYFLDPNGSLLAFISSKDVNPYKTWNIENSLNLGLAINFLGKMNFDLNNFPEYKIRHVDADRHVKDTQSFTYIWSSKTSCEISDKLTKQDYSAPYFCPLCKAGKFYSLEDQQRHFTSRKHLLMQSFDDEWNAYLGDA